MKIKIRNKSTNPLPKFETEMAAGMDLRAFLNESIWIKPGEFKLIPTGLYLELEKGTEAQIRPRSGLAFKHGITVLNSPGTIDADYRGEIGVLLINHSNHSFEIINGERVAQMVIAKYEQPKFIEVEELEDSARGAGGFGSTGKK